MNSLKLLIVEDDPLLGDSLREALEGKGYQARLATTGAAALEAASEEGFDLLLQDIRLPDADGLQILREIFAIQPHCRALVMTGHASVELAVEAMKGGAFDFIAKPFPMEALFLKIERIIDVSRLEREVSTLREARDPLRKLVGQSPAMTALIDTVKAVAAVNSTVMVQGESGTGKELLADAIHALSPRRKGPMVKVNCAAIPESLFESELFGVERGAYTGADRSRAGYIEAATGGTLFLDEIGEMPLQAQGKLLRVIEERTVTRIGSTAQRSVDIRLISATNRDLKAMVEQKTFREDLYYRLSVVPLTVPPLRERREDIPLLIAFFREQLREGGIGGPLRLTPEALEALAAYDYPGNIRELRNVLEKLALLHGGEPIRPRHLPPGMLTPLQLGKQFEVISVGKPLKEAVAEFEQKYIEKVLKSVGGQKALSARILGVSRKVLWEKLTRGRPQ